MRNLTTTVALVALLAGTSMWPAAVTRAQDNSALRNAITAQQQQTLDAAGAPAADTVVLTEEELNDLVAPVALYPDALLAQVLVAATYPLQIAKADQLIDASADMSEDELSTNLERQEFDPSVLVLMSGFPTVVSRMAEDIDWTERLGQAMVGQDEDVLAAVQRMRTEADATGNLTSNAAQVIEKDNDQIYIKPADPKVVYVPTYDPQTVYTSYTPTTPYVAPQSTTASTLGNPLVAGALAFGGALLVQQLFDDDDDHNNNNHKGDWNDYWSGGRPIDWHDRQFYPRPVLYQGPARQTWGQERDQYWDHRANRWQRNDQALQAYQAGRQDTLNSVMRHRDAQVERMREAAREAKDDAAKRHDQVRERRQDAAQRAKQEQAKADAQRQDRLKAAKAAQERQQKGAAEAAKQQEDAKAAAQKERRQKAAQAQKEADAKAARQAAQRQQAADDDAKAKAAQQNKQQQAKAAQQKQEQDDQTKAAQQKKQQQAKAAQQKQQADQAKPTQQQNDQQQAAQKKKQSQQQASQKCKNNPNSKDCKNGN